jgi:hypothetical protein
LIRRCGCFAAHATSQGDRNGNKKQKRRAAPNACQSQLFPSMCSQAFLNRICQSVRECTMLGAKTAIYHLPVAFPELKAPPGRKLNISTNRLPRNRGQNSRMPLF